uniref:ATP synthase F0 subunit 8 n=1 Tax=Perinereis aibuhitensis TaxID=126650 RepID=X2CTB9_PERAI|nr:ATP synthase F0 subunit 8 [Perinereis aibuhitensis]YP_010400401.1 ATP synthase F0 subunit 8 [Perinereis linea]AHA13376.1 ATP synthase F0 subunit 8 [Perinereis aibuhitensis]UQS76100.1 ATP synthase F0 subunit 8 [Perinereis linea]
MPHLSPMNWLITPLIMLLILTSLMIIMWWQFVPRFPLFSNKSLSSSFSSFWHW